MTTDPVFEEKQHQVMIWLLSSIEQAYYHGIPSRRAFLSLADHIDSAENLAHCVSAMALVACSEAYGDEQPPRLLLQNRLRMGEVFEFDPNDPSLPEPVKWTGRVMQAEATSDSEGVVDGVKRLLRALDADDSEFVWDCLYMLWRHAYEQAVNAIRHPTIGALAILMPAGWPVGQDSN